MGARVLRVLPDAERVDAALREASRISADAGVGVVDGSGFASFADLVDTLLEECELHPCSPLETRALVMALADGRPGPFGAFARSPAFARGAVDLFEELKLGNAGASELGAAAGTLPGRADRLVYLAELFLEYRKALRARGWADRVDRLELARERLERGLPPAWKRFSGIELSGLYDFPPARLGLVLALWRACDREGLGFAWRLPAGLSRGVDAAVDSTFAAMERAAPELAGSALSKDEPDAQTRPFSVLGRVLFSEGEETVELPEPLECVTAPNPRAEVVEIARRVRRWVDEGVPPERIAVAFRNLGEEAEALEEALAERGVRARARRGVPLAASPIGHALLGLPSLVEDGFPAARVAGLLSAGHGVGDEAIPEAPLKWFARAGVRDDRLGAREGRGAFSLRLEALAQRLGGKRPWEADEVRVLSRSVERVISAASAIPDRGTAVELVRAWRQAATSLAHPRRELPRDPLRRSERVLRAVASEQKAYDALLGLGETLERALEAAGAAARPLTRTELQALLWDAAGEVNVTGAGTVLGAVRILEVRELVAHTFDCVALGGLSEGRFPVESGGGGLLSEEERFAVNREAGRDIFRDRAGDFDGRIRWALAEDRLLLHQALSAATGAVWASTARTGVDGRPLRPSGFFGELLHRTGAQARELPARVVPLLSEVTSERELRTALALQCAVRPELRLGVAEVAAEDVLAAVREPWLEEARRLAAIEDQRARFFATEDVPPDAFSGKVEGEALARARARLTFGQDAPVSASTLGAFGNCRFSGLYGHLLRLRLPEEAGEDLDARTRGTFWHAVVREVYGELSRRGWLERTAREIPDELLDQALAKATAELEASSPIGHPELWALSQTRARAMIRRLLDAEHRGLPFGAEHVFGELAFGTESASPPYRTVKLPGTEEEGDVFLRGAIDRLDVTVDGGGVVDFKARKLETSALAESLLVSDFQLPLYLHVVRSAGHGSVRRAGWISLRTAEVVELDAVLAKDGTTDLDELLEMDPARRKAIAEAGGKNLANTVHGLLQTVRAGDFAPRAHDCEWCDLKAVCRIGAAKTGAAG